MISWEGFVNAIRVVSFKENLKQIIRLISSFEPNRRITEIARKVFYPFLIGSSLVLCTFQHLFL